MKVFISWSGELSRSVAEALREWIPTVLQAVIPWMSSEDIDKGARWSSDIAGELSETKFGIICVTPDNLEAPWLNFEAGALSKTIEKTLVCPYLLGLKPSDLRGPLVQFQASVTEKEDTRRLISTLNTALGEDGLPDRKLEKTFEVWWPDLEKQLEEFRSTKIASRPARRPEREILEEILDLVRSQTRNSKLLAEAAGELNIQQRVLEAFSYPSKRELLETFVVRPTGGRPAKRKTKSEEPERPSPGDRPIIK